MEKCSGICKTIGSESSDCAGEERILQLPVKIQIGNCETNVSQSGGVQIYDLENDTHARLSAKAVPRSRHNEAMTAAALILSDEEMKSST